MSVKFTEPSPPFSLPQPVTATVDLRLARDLVTVSEYNAFCEATGRDPITDQVPTNPVSNVSWNDCKAYCQWFSVHHYVQARLPYEYELCLAEQYEKIADRDFDGWPHLSVTTARVPGKRWNDIDGRVYQWCEDGNTSYRVNRGGSWRNYPRRARVANRSRNAPGLRYNDLGFRLAFDVE